MGILELACALTVAFTTGGYIFPKYLGIKEYRRGTK